MRRCPVNFTTHQGHGNNLMNPNKDGESLWVAVLIHGFPRDVGEMVGRSCYTRAVRAGDRKAEPYEGGSKVLIGTWRLARLVREWKSTWMKHVIVNVSELSERTEKGDDD